METRDALLFSDGSLTLFAKGWPLEKIEAERQEVDKNETDPAHMTKVARVQFEVVEILFSPTNLPPAPMSEMDRLKADNADLRRQLEAVGASHG